MKNKWCSRHIGLVGLGVVLLGASMRASATLEGYCTASRPGGWYALGPDCMTAAYAAAHESLWTDSVNGLIDQFRRDNTSMRPQATNPVRSELPAEKIESADYEAWCEACGGKNPFGWFRTTQHICKDGYYVVMGPLRLPVCRPDPCYGANKHVNTITGECLPDSPRHRGEQCEVAESPRVFNPIDPANGNKTQRETDYAAPDRALFRVERTYNSIVPETRRGNLYVSGTRFGAHWVDFYDRTIEYYAPSPYAGAHLRRADGRDLAYQLGNGVWNPIAPDTPEILKSTATGYTVTTPDGVMETYDTSGRLLRMDDATGYYVTLDYGVSVADGGDGNPNTLDTVSDRFGRRIRYGYDSQSLVSTITLPDQQQLRYAFPPLPLAAPEPGQLPDGTHPQNAMPQAMRLLGSVTYPDRTTRTYLYDEATSSDAAGARGRLTGIVDEKGQRYATFRYDSRGRARGGHHGPESLAADLTRVSYDASGSATVVDALGQARTYSYAVTTANTYGSADLKHTSVTGGPCASCGGTTAGQAFDDFGKLTSKTDFLGNRTLFHFDAANREDCRLEGIPGPGIAPAYRKTVTTYPADRAQRVPKAVKVYAANPSFAPPAACDPAATPNMTLVLETTFEYVALAPPYFLVASKVEHDPVHDQTRTTSYHYYGEPNGDPADPADLRYLLKSATGPNPANTTRYFYATVTDADHTVGDLVKTTNALDQSTLITRHDRNGRPLSITDPNGMVTGFAYRPRGWLQTRNVGGSVTSFDYDATGKIQRIDQPNGASLTFAYDQAHRLTDIYDSLKNNVHYTLDAAGNAVSEQTTDSTGVLRKEIGRTFGRLGELSSITTAGNVTNFTYDDNSRLRRTLDPRDASGNTYGENTYDARGRVIEYQDALNVNHTLTTYDVFDAITSVTDPNGQTTRYTNDAFGDVLEVLSPDTRDDLTGGAGTTRHRYDAAGNLQRTTDPRGVTVVYEHDALNRLQTISYPTHGDPGVRLTYDDASQGQNEIGRLSTMQDETGVTTYSYDSRGNVARKSELRRGSSSPAITAYAYDAADSLREITYPTGRTVTYQRDAAGRIRQLDTAQGGVRKTLFSNGQYEPFGPLTSWAFGNGIAAQVSHDRAYRTATIQQGSALKLDYTNRYDAADNILQIQDLLGADSKAFAYDALHRLRAEATIVSSAYTYDAVGNRQSAGAAVYTYDPARRNWLAKLASWSGPTALYWTLDHDQAGHPKEKKLFLTAGGPASESFLYFYGDNGRLSSIQRKRSDGTLDFTRTRHNALGQPAFQFTAPDLNSGTPASTGELFFYDEAGHLLDLTAIAPTQSTQEYIYADDLPIAYYVYGAPGTAPAGPYYLHGDHLGTPQKATDGTGATVVSLRYTAFGRRTVVANTVAPPRLGFPGQFSSYTGWFSFNHFREYDPGLGRYLEADPIGLAGGLNPYLYASANPLRLTDTHGLFVASEVGRGGNGPGGSAGHGPLGLRSPVSSTTHGAKAVPDGEKKCLVKSGMDSEWCPLVSEQGSSCIYDCPFSGRIVVFKWDFGISKVGSCPAGYRRFN